MHWGKHVSFEKQSTQRNRTQFVQVNYKRRLFRLRQAFEESLWSVLSSVGMHSQSAGMNQCSHTSVTRLLVSSVWCTACVPYSQMDSESTFSQTEFDFTFWNDEGFFFFFSAECCSEPLNVKYWTAGKSQVFMIWICSNMTMLQSSHVQSRVMNTFGKNWLLDGPYSSYISSLTLLLLWLNGSKSFQCGIKRFWKAL